MNNKLIKVITIIICAIIMIVFEIVSPSLFKDGTINTLFNDTIIRFFGSIIFLMFLSNWYPSVLKIRKNFIKNTLIVLPCYLVAINNIPSVALINGDVTINGKASIIIMFAIRSIAVAMFEEFAFRGLLFGVLLEKHHSNKKHIIVSIIISSAIFGLIHITNLFYGSGIVPVLMQVGYSFLIGAMCAFVLIETSSIFHCILVHALFNFCGEIVTYAGNGDMVNLIQIILTSIIAILCLVYVLIRIKKYDVRKVESTLYETQHD